MKIFHFEAFFMIFQTNLAKFFSFELFFNEIFNFESFLIQVRLGFQDRLLPRPWTWWTWRPLRPWTHTTGQKWPCQHIFLNIHHERIEKLHRRTTDGLTVL